jgi:1,4-dihydroxy-6-naphthoate synthase
MAVTTLGISPCPNDTFAFHALVHGLVPGAPLVATDYADIDVLNTWAAQGSHDVVKVSYGALPWLLTDYALLPSGGALGRGCGPLVVTLPGVSGLRGASVAVPGERTTAYLLFRLWAAGRALDVQVVVLPFDQIMPAVRDGSVTAGLVIHESRFTYPGYGLESLADLGDWWEGQTGLPIPLGAILARRTLDLDILAVAIRASVELAWADPAATREYVRAHAQEMDEAVCAAHIGLYVNSFTADLGDEGYAAVEELLGRAAAAGLTPRLPASVRT